MFICTALLAMGCSKQKPQDAATGAPPSVPQRIVSQAVLADELLWELGEDVRKRVVAVSKFADDGRYSHHPGRWPKQVKRLGARAEDIVALSADLVIVASFSSPEVLDLLNKAGIKTLVLNDFDGFSGLQRTIDAIANRVDATTQGKVLGQRWKASVAGLKKTPHRRSVLSWSDAMVAGSETTFDAVATAAGLDNLAASKGIKGHKRISFEQLLTWNPELIILPCQPDCAVAKSSFHSQPGAQGLTAVKTERVLAIEPRALYATGFGMLDLAQQLVSAAADSTQ